MDLKPKVRLTEEYVVLINRWYNTQISADRLLNWPCFSQPDLSSHSCNVFAKLPGEHDCDHCEHVPYRLCHVMCYIHHFCLASFAARLNLHSMVGASIDELIINILKKWKYPTLNKRVVQALDLISDAKVSSLNSVPTIGKKEEELPELLEKLPEGIVEEPIKQLGETRYHLIEEDFLDLDPQDPDPTEEPVEEIIPPMPSSFFVNLEEPETELAQETEQVTPQEFYTIEQAAERLDCSNATISKYLSTGGEAKDGTMVKLECQKIGRKKMIPVSSIEAFEQADVKRRKRRKKSEKDEN